VIKQLEGEFVPWDLFSARVLGAYRSYGDALCWTQDGASVMSLVNGFVFLAAKESADWEELTAFLQMQPWAQMQCGEEVAAKLPFRSDWAGLVFRFVGQKQAPMAPMDYSINPGPAAIFDLLKRCGFHLGDRAEWMADLAMRWRKGTARSWLLGDACTASAIDITDTHVYVSVVGTAPEHRGKGLAGQLLTHICGYYRGRTVWLTCGEGMRGFYESIGFEAAGRAVMMNKEAA